MEGRNSFFIYLKLTGRECSVTGKEPIRIKRLKKYKIKNIKYNVAVLLKIIRLLNSNTTIIYYHFRLNCCSFFITLKKITLLLLNYI
jgi:hypothetical protein